VYTSYVMLCPKSQPAKQLFSVWTTQSPLPYY